MSDIENPFLAQTEALVNSIPRGRVTTYAAIARVLDSRLSSEDAAKFIMEICRPTVLALISKNAINPAHLPCWRIVNDNPPDKLSPLESGSQPVAKEYLELVVSPLINDGIMLEPPLYRIPEECFYGGDISSWPESARVVDEEIIRARDTYFLKRHLGKTLSERCAEVNTSGRCSLGFVDEPVGYVYHMALKSDGSGDIAVDVAAPSFWEGIRTINVPRYDEEEDEEASTIDEVDGNIFMIETQLEDGRWRLWAPQADGSFKVPRFDDMQRDLVYAPLDCERNALLDQMKRILNMAGGRINWFQSPEQWRSSPAPQTAWDPPQLLRYVNMARVAPFLIHAVDLDEGATEWTFVMESVHFPEIMRTVHVMTESDETDSMNAAGQVWQELNARCSAWFDLHYSDQVPEDQRLIVYTYGGWHRQPDGTWMIKRRSS